MLVSALNTNIQMARITEIITAATLVTTADTQAN